MQKFNQLLAVHGNGGGSGLLVEIFKFSKAIKKLNPAIK